MNLNYLTQSFTRNVFSIVTAFAIILSFGFLSHKGLVKTSLNKEKTTKIILTTNYGTIILKLSNETPLHRDNFIKLVEEKKYDGLLFHRVIDSFMIQTGDPDSKLAMENDTLGSGDIDYTIPAEIKKTLFHKKGALAAARDGNPERASSGMQFYLVKGKVFNDSLLLRAEVRINDWLAQHYAKKDPLHKVWVDSMEMAYNNQDKDRYNVLRDTLQALVDFEKYSIPENQREIYKTIGGTPHLDQNYTVFGEVIGGQEVVDSIAEQPTDKFDRPINDVRIISAKIISK